MSLRARKTESPKSKVFAARLSFPAAAIWIAVWFLDHKTLWTSMAVMYFAIGAALIEEAACARKKETGDQVIGDEG